MKCLIPVAPLSAALLATFALAGCQHQYQQTISYPKLLPAGAIEAGFDCAQLDDSILKTDAVRWVMREDGARLVSPGKELAVIMLVALDEGHNAVHRADLRLHSLLSLKKDRHCLPRPTGHEAMTDLDLYEKLAALLDQEKTKESSAHTAELRAQRMQLLDKLRPN
jgi:hypothetical protein